MIQRSRSQLPGRLSRRAELRRRLPAFTLVELMINLAVATVIMGVLSSAMLMATHALPSGDGPLPDAVQGYETVEQIAGDLFVATAFSDRTAKGVEFTVADRNGDSNPDTILYEWDGTPGHSLIRCYNGGSKRVIATDVHEFKLDYFTETKSVQPPPADTESAEVLLAAQDTAVSLKDYSLTSRDVLGQYFAPTLPSDATRWAVTRVRFKAKANGTQGGITAVELRSPDKDKLPSGTVLDKAVMNESGLSTAYTWRNFLFSQVSNLKPGSGLCLALVLQQNDSVLADIQFENGGGSDRLVSGNGGTSWSGSKSQSMIYQVYGTYTSKSTPPATLQRFLTFVGITLRIGADTSTRVQTAVQVLNRPQVTVFSEIEIQ